MAPLDEKKIIAKWSENALKLMVEHDVTHLPENYAVWFDYVRGNNKKLKEAIDKHIKSSKPFTHELNKKFYLEYIVKELDNRVIVEASNKVQQIMASVLRAVEDSSTDRESYNQELETFTKDLEDAGVAEEGQMQSAISKIISKTQELKEKGETLNSKLNESRNEVESLKSTLEEVSLQVSLDGLTGIANRKAFDESLAMQMRDAKENNKHLCLLMVDVDHFKRFNDTYGHLIGDQVLKIVAQSMKDVVKGRDFVARYGGEEFAIILPETPLKGGEIVGEMIRKAIASRELKRKDTGESYGSITVSIGVAALNARYDRPDDFITRADKALYLSKKNGRNMVTVEESK